MSETEDRFAPMTTNKFVFTLSREQELLYGWDDYTAEELAAHNAKMSAFHAEQRDLRAHMLGLLADLRNMSSLGNAILDLHSTDTEAEWDSECNGCDFAGYEGEPPAWPCRTVLALAEHYAVPMPDKALPGKHYEGEYVPHDGKRWQMPRLTGFVDAIGRSIDAATFHGTGDDPRQTRHTSAESAATGPVDQNPTDEVLGRQIEGERP